MGRDTERSPSPGHGHTGQCRQGHGHGRHGFEGVLTHRDGHRKRAPPTPQARSFSERPGQPCPELRGARNPTFPAAPCRPCLLAASPPPCRSQPSRSPPLPEQLPRIEVTRSGMGPQRLPSHETPEPGWPSLRRESLELRTTHSVAPFPSFQTHLKQRPQRAGAQPEWPGGLSGPGAASSL